MNQNDVEHIDMCIRLNYSLISDGPHPAVDAAAVRAAIDRLLERRLVVTRDGDTQGGKQP